MYFKEEHVSNCDLRENAYLCEKCGQSFGTKASMVSHVRFKHDRISTNHECSVCRKKFTRNWLLVRHQKICQDINENIKINEDCFFCGFSARSKAAIIKHYELKHDISFTRKTLNFNAFEGFKIWKQKFEKDTKSHFIKTTGTRCTKNGVNIAKYICHRDGYYRSKSKGVRHAKIVGSNKINSRCPAYIAVSETDLSVKVVYMDTHIGHELELSRLNISESERADIAQKLVKKIPFDQILGDIRDSVADSELQRIHLITRKDLWNITKSYNLSREVINKSDLSVDASVLDMQKSSNLVRFYKPQGNTLENFSELKEEDFVLVIMNDAQKDILLKFGNNCVCLDNVHDANACDYQLYTIMVLDEMGQGFPCSFLFSNRGDAVAMEIFFKTIKDSLQDASIQPKTFMSDVDDTFFSAWSSVIGPVQNRLFSSWHINGAWRTILQKIENIQKQDVVYEKIKTITHETEINTFCLMVNNLLEELRSDTDCLEFSKHFEEYVKRCSSWAYCFRKGCGISTDTNFENMHKLLKHLYSRGKKMKRMGKAISIFMNFIRDKLVDRLLVQNKEEFAKKLTSIRQIHKKSLGLKNTIVDLGNSWDVHATNCKDAYRVKPSNPACNCNIRCQDCETCIHSYKCSCIDSSIKSNMCKHIHLVSMSMKSSRTSAVQSDSGDKPAVLNEELIVLTSAVQSDSDDTPAVLNEELVVLNEIGCEMDVTNDNISETTSIEEGSAVPRVVSEAKRHSFHERKSDLLDRFLRVYNAVESEEQLEAVWKQLAPLEGIMEAVPGEDIPIPTASENHLAKL